MEGFNVPVVYLPSTRVTQPLLVATHQHLKFWSCNEKVDTLFRQLGGYLDGTAVQILRG